MDGMAFLACPPTAVPSLMASGGKLRKGWVNSKRIQEYPLPIIPRPQPAAWSQDLSRERVSLGHHCPWEKRDEPCGPCRGDPREVLSRWHPHLCLLGQSLLSCPSLCLRPLQAMPPSGNGVFLHSFPTEDGLVSLLTLRLQQVCPECPATQHSTAHGWAPERLLHPRSPVRFTRHTSGCNPCIPTSGPWLPTSPALGWGQLPTAPVGLLHREVEAQEAPTQFGAWGPGQRTSQGQRKVDAKSLIIHL